MQAHYTSRQIIAAAYRVHEKLGPGLLEVCYKQAMKLALVKTGMHITVEEPYEVRYEEELIGRYFTDLVAENEVIVECKAVSKLAGIHYSQLMNYLRISGKHVGYLVNFKNRTLEFRRVVLN